MNTARRQIHPHRHGDVEHTHEHDHLPGIAHDDPRAHTHHDECYRPNGLPVALTTWQLRPVTPALGAART